MLKQVQHDEMEFFGGGCSMDMERRARLVAAARGLIGTPVRARGRLAGVALDCVGVALAAYRGAGFAFDVPNDYSLAGDNRARLCGVLAALGFARVAEAADGDLVEAEVGGRQHHLGVSTGGSLVHAHFGVGRVVETRMPAEWRVVAVWAYGRRGGRVRAARGGASLGPL